MKKTIILVALLLPAIYLSAQNQLVGNLTIFSEDGEKFFLILNGEKQNEVPQSNIRIEELPQPYYNAKIIFQDASIAVITKSNLMIASADGILMDVTYKVSRDKSGKPRLNYYSSIPVQQNFIPPSGMYVRHYGRRNPGVDGVVTTTTTSTTTTSAANTNMVDVSVNGVGMNVTISDPNMPVVTEKTTVTTTTSSSSVNARNNNVSSATSRGCNRPMTVNDFASAKNTITAASFEDSRLSTAKSILSANCVSTNQVIEICGLFNFEETKLAFAQYAYKYTTDPKNYYKVGTVFSFDTSRDKLNKFLTDN